MAEKRMVGGVMVDVADLGDPELEALYQKNAEYEAEIFRGPEALDGNTEVPAPVDAIEEPATDSAEPVETEASAEATESADPVKAEPSELEKLQHELKVLQGKYSAEVPRLAAQLREKKEELRVMAEKLAAGPVDSVKPISQMSADELKSQFGLTDEEIEYGPEIFKGAQKVAQKLIQEREQAFKSEIESIRETLAMEKFDQFYGRVKQTIPQADEINSSPEFAEWLSKPDPLSGIVRQELLDRASGSYDHTRASLIFEQYLKDSGKQSLPASPEPKQPVTPAVDERLAAQAMPEVGHPSVASGKKTYTRAEYDQLRVAALTAADSGDTTRYKQITKEIDAALHEGRVIG